MVKRGFKVKNHVFKEAFTGYAIEAIKKDNYLNKREINVYIPQRILNQHYFMFIDVKTTTMIVQDIHLDHIRNMTNQILFGVVTRLLKKLKEKIEKVNWAVVAKAKLKGINLVTKEWVLDKGRYKTKFDALIDLSTSGKIRMYKWEKAYPHILRLGK